MSYSAIISTIHTKPHPNGDNIQLGIVCGDQVIVGKDTQSGEVGVYFASDGQLSEEYAKANNLCAIYDETGKKIGGGYLDALRRIRAQNFRGEKSEGLWMPLSSLAFTGINLSSLKEGFEFVGLNGIPICNKYETDATRQRKQENKQKQKAKNKVKGPKVYWEFPLHFDTLQLKKNMHRIPVGSRLILTAKVHGTSSRIMHACKEITYTFPWWKRLIAKIFRLPLQTTVQEYSHVMGSRNVTLDKEKSGGHEHQKLDFREASLGAMNGNLRKGEIVFYEIVGFQGDKSIMPSVETKAIGDKKVQKQYGKMMNYFYGCKPGETKSFIYRIANVNADGYVQDLPWEQVVARAEELQTPVVPLLGIIENFDGDTEKLQEWIVKYLDKPSVIDASHVEEGVCLRVEHGMKMEIFKQKGFIFSVLEGIAKDVDYVDEEESNSIDEKEE